jgi:hypothetical protein
MVVNDAESASLALMTKYKRETNVTKREMTELNLGASFS